jgi:hypothetical protein
MPALWGQVDGPPMCSWCGAHSERDHMRLRAEDGAYCPHCHYAPRVS